MDSQIYTDIINSQQELIRHLREQLEKEKEKAKEIEKVANPLVDVEVPEPTKKIKVQLKRKQTSKFLQVPDERDCTKSCAGMKTESSIYLHTGRVRRMDFSNVLADLSNLESEIEKQFGHFSTSTLKAYKISIGKYVKQDLGLDTNLVKDAYQVKPVAKPIQDTRTYDELSKAFIDKANDINIESKFRTAYALYGYIPPMRQCVYLKCIWGDSSNPDKSKNYLDINKKVLQINTDKSNSSVGAREIQLTDDFLKWVNDMKVDTNGKVFTQSADRLTILLKKVIPVRPVQTLRHAFQSAQVNNAVSREEFEKNCNILGHTPMTALKTYATSIDNDKFYHSEK